MRVTKYDGTNVLQYETPCGWCTRLNMACTEKGCKKKSNRATIDSKDEVEKLCNILGCGLSGEVVE